MKTTLKFLKDFYSPLHKKTFIASDSKKNSIEIDVDADGVPIHSFWFTQLKDSPEYFSLEASSPKSPKIKSE